MIIYSCHLTLLIFDSYSLKDKRSVLKSIINKGRQKFNISLAEIGSNEIHNKAELGLSCVANTKLICEQTLQSFIHFVEGNYSVEILNYEIEEH
jgi:hypothetical protein